MRKAEQRMWDYLSGQMKGRWDVQRHEDRYSQDIPDLSFALGGREGWIELKTVKAWPKRPATAIRIPHLTAGQVNWLEQRYKLGGRNAYLLLAVGDTMASADWIIFEGDQVRHLRTGCFLRDQLVRLWHPNPRLSLGEALLNYLDK